MKRILMLLMLLSGSTFWANKAGASSVSNLQTLTFRACLKCIPFKKGPDVLGVFYPKGVQAETQQEMNSIIDASIEDGYIKNYFGITAPLSDPLLQTIAQMGKAIAAKDGDSQKIIQNVDSIINKYLELRDSGITNEEFKKTLDDMVRNTNPEAFPVEEEKIPEVEKQVVSNPNSTFTSNSISKPINTGNSGSSSDEQKNPASQDVTDNAIKNEDVASSAVIAPPASSSPVVVDEQKEIPKTAGVAAAGTAAVGASRGIVDSRINNNLTTNKDTALNEQSGTAAGDETPVEYGLWVKGVTSRAKQKEYKTNPQYKLMQNGGVIGFDFGKENYVFGIAYTFVQGKINGQDFGTGEKIISNIGTIYGMLKFDNNLFVSGQAQYGRSRLKKNRNIGNVAGTIIQGKTKGVMTGAKLETGYDYYNKMMETHFVPSVGVSYDDVIVKGYNELGYYPIKTNDKTNAEKNSLLAGLSVRRDFKVEGITIAPEVHVDFDYAMLNKHSKVETMGLSTTIVPVAKLARTAYQVGGSLKLAKNGAINITVGYDLGLSKKFRSHTSYVSAKMKF